METNQTDLNSKVERLVTNLEETLKILERQAMIAECRMRIQKANLEEILYALKINELKEPKNEPNKDQTNSGPGEN